MNKTEALARLDALESEAAALRRIIEAPEPVAKKPLVQAKDDRGYSIVWSADGYFAYNNGKRHNGFETWDQALAYAEAFNTLLDLRRQPGSGAAEAGKMQWFIRATGDIGYWATQHKMALLCPMFDTQESAEAARDAVGLDRILRMYNTLHGRGYG